MMFADADICIANSSSPTGCQVGTDSAMQVQEQRFIQWAGGEQTIFDILLDF